MELEKELKVMEENKEVQLQNLKMLDAVSSAQILLNRSYLQSLNRSEIQKLSESELSAPESELMEKVHDSSSFFNITRIVLSKNENMRDKLTTLFNALGNTGCSLIFFLKSTKDKVRIYLGVRNAEKNDSVEGQKVLESSIKGNFPGTEIKLCDQTVIKEIHKSLDSNSISSVSTIASLRFEEQQENQNRSFVQGIEKLIDALRGDDYALLLIADPVGDSDLKNSRQALENLYSSLVPFSERQITMTENESLSISSSISESTSHTINNSISETLSFTNGLSHSYGKTFSDGVSTTEGTTETFGTSVTGTVGGHGGAHVGVGGAGVNFGLHASVATGRNHSDSITKSNSKNSNKGTTSTDTVNDSSTKGNTKQYGSADGNTETLTSGNSSTSSSGLSIQIKEENFSVKQIMERIKETLERYSVCADVGMWNCAIYCMSGTPVTASLAAKAYNSLMRGRKSSLEDGAITKWESGNIPLLRNYLLRLKHPVLKQGNFVFTPGTLISSSELAIHAGLPNHSVPGIPVLECAEFGRTVSTYDSVSDIDVKNYSVKIGKIWHMNQEENLPVDLNPDSLASHTFITGSTGAGKSNTVYQILSECHRLGKKFLVVEPAKGEYKNIFGGNCDVSVYGTNPDLTALLRINPFSFPHGNEDSAKNIHILEHLDRLIEIFNVCWPMYAAMPAVLKEAVEKSYEDCGWNLTESTNLDYGDNLYPSFADVTRNIRTIIDSSEYDSENKGAYKGSLITRLKSLTNGINGLIFTSDEIPAKDLFDENVIVDLSRVGSAETKSLIMGLLVLKLQEYRMTGSEMNAPLRHVTVLEEAHNLLKRTSTEQSQDSGNLLGKSVEMLTNSIAEMRTYGEGFIIADQAPALLDMAVIRNTNTKIIMRLPDKDDRELVGKAANLNDDQITELAKLPRGVAAVYQNEWVEAVLCKVKHFKDEANPLKYKKPEKQAVADDVSDRIEIARLLCKGTAVNNEGELNKLKEKLDAVNICASTRVMILKSAKEPPAYPRYTKLAPVVSELFPDVRSAFVESFARTSDTVQWTDDVDNAIKSKMQSDLDEELLRSIRQCIITDYLHNELGKIDLLEQWNREAVR